MGILGPWRARVRRVPRGPCGNDVVQLERIVEQLTARIAELEQELALAAKADPAGAPEAPRAGSAASSSQRPRRRRGRSPGGQTGHEGYGRSWVPVEQVGPADPGQAPPLRPMRPLADGRRSPSPAPSGGGDSSGAGPGHRVSVARPALPPLRGACTEADWPEGVSRPTFGPSVQAWVALLAGTYRMSQRNIVQLLADAFGVRLSVGTVSRLEQAVSAALAGRWRRRAPSFVSRPRSISTRPAGGSAAARPGCGPR